MVEKIDNPGYSHFLNRTLTSYVTIPFVLVALVALHLLRALLRK